MFGDEVARRCAFRISITDRRLLALNDTHVTFRYKDRKADRHKPCTLTGHEFMRRYLQNVLPKGFHKIHDFGLWHPAKRDQRDHLRRVLLLQQRHAPEPGAKTGDDDTGQQQTPLETALQRSRCQHCHKGKLIFIRRLLPIWPRGSLEALQSQNLKVVGSNPTPQPSQAIQIPS
ncbi:MAG: hypothetical protein HC869_07675 [Rhodospirillales bacterium]|nr:hypothetical protein [Rhodospirillales bacterium]